MAAPGGEPLRFAGPRVSGAVRPLGAMLDDCRFDLGDGRLVAPLVVAPWAEEPDLDPATPPLLAALRGEWPCVPFGMPAPPAGLPADWSASADPDAFVDPEPHGFGANADWALMAERTGGVLAAIGYPAPHPVRWLERTVRADAEAAALDLSLTVHVRRDAALPVGLHPVFRLPAAPGTARLGFAPATRAWTLPVAAEPGASRCAADVRGADPAAVPAAGGGSLDLARLPPQGLENGPSEDIVLLTGTGGRITLDHPDEGWRALLEWDAGLLPGCLLWISNGGRGFPPWNGRFRGIGIEPVAAPFDLGTAIAAGRNPLAAAGIATTVAFRAGHPLTIAYRITVEALG